MGLVHRVVPAAELESVDARILRSNRRQCAAHHARGEAHHPRGHAAPITTRERCRAWVKECFDSADYAGRPQGFHGEAQTRSSRGNDDEADCSNRNGPGLRPRCGGAGRVSVQGRSPSWSASSPAAAPTRRRASCRSRSRDQLGQQVVVENRAGAGGNIAVDYVAKAAPDGHTLVLANVGALAVNPHIMKTPYDPLKDLTPISMAVVFANVLVVQPSLQVEHARRVRQARDARSTARRDLRAPPASAAPGTSRASCSRAWPRSNLVHVPYKGGGPAMQGFLGGAGRFVLRHADLVDLADPQRQGEGGRDDRLEARRAHARCPDRRRIGLSRLRGAQLVRLPRAGEDAARTSSSGWNREIVKALANREAVAQMHKTGVEPQSSTPAELRHVHRARVPDLGQGREGSGHQGAMKAYFLQSAGERMQLELREVPTAAARRRPAAGEDARRRA